MSTMVNGIGWFEIGADDAAAAERFYGEVFGWTFADDPDSNMLYRIVTTPAEGSIRGGVLGTGGAMPSYAIFYVLVADVPQACRQAEAAGGKVLVPPTTSESGLTFAHLADPAGSHFGVFKPPAAS
jgi:uncharacterized protein